MAKITLYNEHPASATYVPNIFIDEYMTRANGEYVKIYLYLLRCMNQVECRFSLSQIADHFDCTERDVLRALKYWEKLHLFRLEYDAGQNLSGICFLSGEAMPPAAGPAVKKDVTNSFIQAAAPKQPSYTMDEIRQFCGQEDIGELIFIAEQYLGRTMNQSDLSRIFFWYDELHLSVDLIEFLIESCVAKGHKSLHYMEKIAEDFAAKQIRTVEEAKQIFSQDTAVYHAVMKAFGIRGRNLVPLETDFLKNWNQKMGFSSELIAEACCRTINAIHEPSFVYADSILRKWYENQIHTMDDVKKADEAYQQSLRDKQIKTPAAGTNRFINFKQRDNNYEDLQKQLIQNSLK